MLDRRNFMGTLIGGVAAGAAVRTWPFRVFSFPSEIVTGNSFFGHGLLPELVVVQWKLYGVPYPGAAPILLAEKFVRDVSPVIFDVPAGAQFDRVEVTVPRTKSVNVPGIVIQERWGTKRTLLVKDPI